MVTSVTKGGYTDCPTTLRLSKPTDMTIHRKALDEHFQMVQLVFQFIFRGKMNFLIFFSKKLQVFKGFGQRDNHLAKYTLYIQLLFMNKFMQAMNRNFEYYVPQVGMQQIAWGSHAEHHIQN
jgi:hypothetical protein